MKTVKTINNSYHELRLKHQEIDEFKAVRKNARKTTVRQIVRVQQFQLAIQQLLRWNMSFPIPPKIRLLIMNQIVNFVNRLIWQIIRLEI